MAVRFIAKFLFPVLSITRAAHNGMRKMQQQMDQMQQQQNKTATPSQSKVKEDDYIDYEEVK